MKNLIVVCLFLIGLSVKGQVPTNLPDSTKLSATLTWKDWKIVFRTIHTSGKLTGAECTDFEDWLKSNLKIIHDPANIPNTDLKPKK